MIVLILGSGPSVIACRDWPRAPFDRIVAINNAWAVRTDWDHLIYPDDFPPDRHPPRMTAQQSVVTASDFVPANNAFGGIIYAGGTMAFTAGYWALHALRPRVMAFMGCDMVYPAGRSHFYGQGSADPLRPDPTLQDLGAKSVRLEALAARAGCAVVNLSEEESRLCLTRAARSDLPTVQPARFSARAIDAALAAEDMLGARVPSGRYWEDGAPDSGALARIDALWRAALPEDRHRQSDKRLPEQAYAAIR